MNSLHRILLAAILALNTIAFAGVDPITRVLTAALVLAMAWDLRRMPTIPRLHRWVLALFAVLVILQLTPMPGALRRILLPGCHAFIDLSWAPLSLAPWATLHSATSSILLVVIALTAARMAMTRSGLPVLLGIIAAAGGLLALLGLVSEGGDAGTVLLMRENTAGGGPYGPFLNGNHFTQAIELTMPALLVFLAASARNIGRRRSGSERALVFGLAGAIGVAISVAAVLRSASRGGIIFLAAGCLISIPWWLRYKGGRRWPWLLVFLIILSAAVVFAWTNLPVVQERMLEMISIEGADGNTRLDMWRGTFELFTRAPVLGVGLGSYRYAIGLDKPASGGYVIVNAHNDWLEWLSTTGVLGAFIVGLAVLGLALHLRPKSIRRLRFEYRYPMAALVAVLAATALHECVGFGLQTPLNRYLLALWIGLFWGIVAKTTSKEES